MRSGLLAILATSVLLHMTQPSGVSAQSVARLRSCLNSCTKNLLKTRTPYPGSTSCYCECESTGGIFTLKCCRNNEIFNNMSKDTSSSPCKPKPGMVILGDGIVDEIQPLPTTLPTTQVPKVALNVAQMRPCTYNCTISELNKRKGYFDNTSCYCDCEQTGGIYTLKCCEEDKIYDVISFTTASTPCRDQHWLLGNNRTGPPRPILLFP